MRSVGCYFCNEHRLSSCSPPENRAFWGFYLAFSPEDVFESSHMWMEAETGGGIRPVNLLWLMRCFLLLKKRKTKNLRTSNIQILLKHVRVVASLGFVIMLRPGFGDLLGFFHRVQVASKCSHYRATPGLHFARHVNRIHFPFLVSAQRKRKII